MDPILFAVALGLAIVVLVVVLIALVMLFSRMTVLRKELAQTTQAQNEEREMTHRLLRENREELFNTFARFEDMTNRNLVEARENTVKQLAETRDSTIKQLAESREMVEKRLTLLQEQNEIKLEQMRTTVDEKLQKTVEERFSESFKLISERLEQVHKGLGEMQALAGGVDDLKRVLSNVKTRGNLGEYQLGAILEQVLSPEQYTQNAQVKPRSQERVEYAVRLPGSDEDKNEILLPIDSKFPVEDYERLLDAYEGIGEESAEVVAKRLEMRVKSFARHTRQVYQHTLYHRFCHHVCPNRRFVRGNTTPPGPFSVASKRIPDNRRRPHQSGRVFEQPTHGISHSGHSEAFKRSLAHIGRGKNRVRQI